VTPAPSPSSKEEAVAYRLLHVLTRLIFICCSVKACMAPAAKIPVLGQRRLCLFSFFSLVDSLSS
jgi:hypothetical protein